MLANDSARRSEIYFYLSAALPTSWRASPKYVDIFGPDPKKQLGALFSYLVAPNVPSPW